MKRCIITIGREYGSGGRIIGRQLADKLGVPFYDKELITLAAQKSGMNEEVLAGADESATSGFLYSMAGTYVGSRFAGAPDMPITDKLFLLQAEVIRAAAKAGSCVIVGRCADDILSSDPDLVNVFVHGPLEKRIERCVLYYGLDRDKAEDTIRRMDKRRAGFYNYYSDKKWGRVENYHLAIDSCTFGIENTVNLIEAYVRAR